MQQSANVYMCGVCNHWSNWSLSKHIKLKSPVHHTQAYLQIGGLKITWTTCLWTVRVTKVKHPEKTLLTHKNSTQERPGLRMSAKFSSTEQQYHINIIYIYTFWEFFHFHYI